MDAAIVRRVKALRGQDPFHPISMANAVSIARYEAKARTYAEHGKYPWLAQGITNGYGDEHAEGVVDGLLVRVEVTPDYDHQLGEDDVTGTFGHNYQEGAIKNTLTGWGNGNGADWYYPSHYRETEDDAAETHNGLSRGNVALYRKWLIERDMRDDYSRSYYGVIARVYLDGAEIGYSSLWGIDSVDGYDALPYLYEVAEEQIAEALHEASEWIAEHRMAEPKGDHYTLDLTAADLDALEGALELCIETPNDHYSHDVPAVLDKIKRVRA